jgi:hypothetical protein
MLLGVNLGVESRKWVKATKSYPNIGIAIKQTVEEGGTIYNTSMRLYYRLMYLYLCLSATWKYMLGFEPTWMLEKDLETYRSIQLRPIDGKIYEPWVRKMMSKDCLLIEEKEPPFIAGITWTEINRSIWVGKKVSKTFALKCVTKDK